MALCDICGSPESGTLVSAEQMREAVFVEEFDPFVLGLSTNSQMFQMLGNGAYAYWKETIVAQDGSDWGICSQCMVKLAPHLKAIPKPTGIRVGYGSDHPTIRAIAATLAESKYKHAQAAQDEGSTTAVSRIDPSVLLHEGGREEIRKGTTVERVIEILGDPHGRSREGQIYEDLASHGAIFITPGGVVSQNVPSVSGMEAEYWIYTFKDVRYAITIHTGVVSDVSRYPVREAQDEEPQAATEPHRRSEETFKESLILAERGRLQDAIDGFASIPNGAVEYKVARFNQAVLLARIGFLSDAVGQLESLGETEDTQEALASCRGARTKSAGATACYDVPLKKAPAPPLPASAASRLTEDAAKSADITPSGETTRSDTDQQISDLHQRLLNITGGDRRKVEWLISFERRSSGEADEATLLRLAIARWEDDNQSWR